MTGGRRFVSTSSLACGLRKNWESPARTPRPIRTRLPSARSKTQAQQEPKPAETSTMKMEDVSKWTQKQWNAAKAKWTEKRAQWNDCQTQAKVKNLSGRKSWQFLYDCMTK